MQTCSSSSTSSWAIKKKKWIFSTDQSSWVFWISVPISSTGIRGSSTRLLLPFFSDNREQLVLCFVFVGCWFGVGEWKWTETINHLYWVAEWRTPVITSHFLLSVCNSKLSAWHWIKTKGNCFAIQMMNFYILICSAFSWCSYPNWILMSAAVKEKKKRNASSTCITVHFAISGKLMTLCF